MPMCDRRPLCPLRHASGHLILAYYGKCHSGREPVSKLSMPHQCPFCERVNPSDAKFCNACGAPLHLMPCPQCGAVNDATATTCHQCAAPLPGAGKSASSPSSPGSQPTRTGAAAGPNSLPEAEALDRDAKVFATLQELRQLLAQTESAAGGRVSDWANPGTSPASAGDAAKAITPRLDGVTSYPAPAVSLASEPQPLARRVVLPRRAVIVTAVVLLAAAFAYLASGQRQTADVPQTPAAAGEVRGSGEAAEAGSRANLATAPEAAPASSAPTAVPIVTPGVAPRPQPPAAASVAPGTVPPPPAASVAPGTVPPPPAASVAPGTVPSPPAASVAPGTVPPPPAARAAPAQQVNATRTGSIVQREGQGSGATSAVPAAAASARPRAPETGTGIERPAPPRIGPCTDAVAALGLCTRESTQRRE